MAGRGSAQRLTLPLPAAPASAPPVQGKEPACQVRRGDGVRLPVLAVGIGIYLPPTISSALVVGAMLSWLLLRAERRRATARGDDVKLALEHAERRGTLLASGLIVGESWSA